jgi:hypothetical protein
MSRQIEALMSLEDFETGTEKTCFASSQELQYFVERTLLELVSSSPI